MSYSTILIAEHRNRELPQSYLVEQWFRASVRNLQFLAKNPSLDSVKRTLKQYLKHKFNRVEQNWIEDFHNVAEYLDLVLKCDCIVELENQNGEKIKVAVDVTLDSELVEHKTREIASLSFCAARHELGIDRHWIVVLPGNYLQLDIYDLADKFYSTIDRQQGIDVINFTEQA